MKHEYLIHYGVLGMKWGVRKGDKLLRVETTNAPKKSASEKHRYAYAESDKEPNIPMMKEWKKKYPDKVTLLSLEAKRDLKVANEEQARAAMTKLLKDKKLKRSLKDYRKQRGAMWYPFGSKVNNAFLSVGGNKPLRDAYITELSAKGNQAVTDMAMRITNGDTSAVLLFNVDDFKVKELKR